MDLVFFYGTIKQFSFELQLNEGTMKKLKELFNTHNTLNKLYCNSEQINITSETNSIKIVPVGSFPQHPDGAHEVTEKHISEMAENLKNSGSDILFDYGHESLWNPSAEAAGWSNSAKVEAKPDGLYIEYPQFTEEASQKISSRKFRYFSPVYSLNYKAKDGTHSGASLVSVAITNTPYFNSEIEHIRNSFINKQKRYKLETIRSFFGIDPEEDIGKVDDIITTFINSSGIAHFSDIPEKLLTNGNTLEKLKKDITSLNAKVNSGKSDKAEILVNSAISSGKILGAEKEIWLQFAQSNFETAEQIINNKKVNSTLPRNLNTGNENNSHKSGLDTAAQYIKELGRK